MLVYDSIVVNGGFLGSNRKIDDNGFLRVRTCNITKEQVAPYYGKEIPNWKNFGLESDKVYYVYRPAEELEKAVETFDNLPLTREHIEVDTENVPKDKIVGSLGDRAEYKKPYIKNSLIVYDQKDIDWIMSGKKKELSCGYRYTPIRESGEFNGQHYDFVMKDIIGNHVALVREGRAGHDVMVADEKPDFAIDAENDTMDIKENEMFFDKLLAKDEFKESEHPREKNGQFTSKGGEGYEKKDVFKSRFSKHTVRRDDPNYKAQLSAYKNDLKEAISAFEKNVENQEEKFKWIEKQRLDMAKADLEDLEKFEKDELKNGSEKEYSDEEINEKHREYTKKALELLIEGRSYEEGSEKYKDVQKRLKDLQNDYDDILTAREKKAAKQGVVIHMNGKTEPVGDSKEQEKISIVMKEFEKGELRSGSGKKVTDPKQALAIGYSEAEKAKDKEIPDGQDKPETAGEEKADKEKKMEKEKKESLAEDKCAKDEKIDKRKLIDEIGGILKGKVDEELIRTIIGKAEQIAYNGSEAGEADDAEIKTKEQKEDFAEGVAYGEKKEKEEPKKLDSEHESEGMKKEEEKAEDKCAKDKCDKKMAKDEMTMDIDTIKAQVREEVIADFKAREEARKSVKSVIGDVNVMAFDSCDDIYKMACEKAGMNVEEIASYKDAFKGFMSVKGKLALDAAPKSSGNVEECLKDIRI